MVKLKVIWTKTADIQFVGILDYWLKRNKSNRYSIKLLNIVYSETDNISKSPLLYKLTDFDDVRVAPLGNYSIYFLVTKTSIIILAFWDNRQDSNVLLKLLQST